MVHVITDTWTDNEDIFHQCHTLHVEANVLRYRFGQCSDEVTLTLFKAFSTTHLWSNYNKVSVQKLQVAYNDALRILLERPRWSDLH